MLAVLTYVHIYVSTYVFQYYGIAFWPTSLSISGSHVQPVAVYCEHQELNDGELVHACMRARVCVCVRVCACVCVVVCVCMCECVCVYMHKINMYVYVYLCTCVHPYVHACMHMFIQS